MKKILCVLMALLTIGCLAGCVDHQDGICDECKEEGAYQSLDREIDDELCTKCWIKKGVENW